MMRVHTKVVWQWRDGVLVELPEEGESYEYEGPVALAGSGTPVSRVTHYRGRSDTDTVDGTPTWIAAENTSFGVTIGTAFRIRIGAENTGTAADTILAPAVGTDIGISRCGCGGTLYSNLVNVINGADAGSSADATNVTVQRLSNGTGSFATGSAGYDENETFSCGITNGNFTEIEFGVVLTGGASTVGVGGGETWEFLVSGLTNAPLNKPTFTTPNTNGSDFQHGAQLGGAGNVVSSSSISMTTAVAASSGNLVVVAIAKDNTGTTDGDHSEVTSVTIDGNNATKAVEFTNGTGAAAGGVTTSIWYLQLSGDVSLGATITADFSGAVTAKSISAREYVVASGKAVSVEATNSAATDAAAQVASLDATTSSIECLRIGAHGSERGPTNTTSSGQGQANIVRATNSNWSLWQTSGLLLRSSDIGNDTASNVCLTVQGNISTGTGAASQIGSFTNTTDWASAYVAFRADVGTDFEDGAGSANVDFVSAGTSTSTSSQPGSANVDITATGTGTSTSAQPGSANVDFSAAAVGAAFADAAGSAASVDFSAAATGIALFDGTGSANVDLASAAVSESTSAQPGSANVDFSAAGIGISTADAAGAATSVDFSAAAVGAPLADGAGSANVDFSAAGESPQDGGDAAGDANVDFTSAAVGVSTADAVGAATSVDFTSAAVGAPLFDGAGSANVDFTSAAVGESTDAQAGSTNVDFSASAAGDGETSLEGAANVDFSSASAGESTAESAGSAVVDFASAAAGESTADAVGSANVDFSAAGVAQVGDTVGDANIDFSADAVGAADQAIDAVGEAAIDFAADAIGDEGLDLVGEAVIDFDAQAFGSADTFGDIAGTAVVIDFEVAAASAIRRRPNETIHTSIGGPRGGGSPSGGTVISTRMRSGRSDTEAA